MYLKILKYRDFNLKLKRRAKFFLNKKLSSTLSFSQKQNLIAKPGFEQSFFYFLRDGSLKFKNFPYNKKQLDSKLKSNLTVRLHLNSFEKKRVFSYFLELCFFKFFDADYFRNFPNNFIKTYIHVFNKDDSKEQFRRSSVLRFLKNNLQTKSFDIASAVPYESWSFLEFFNKLNRIYESRVHLETEVFVPRLTLKPDNIVQRSTKFAKIESVLSRESLCELYFFQIQINFSKFRNRSKRQHRFSAFQKQFLINTLLKDLLLSKFCFVLLGLKEEVLNLKLSSSPESKRVRKKENWSSLLSLQNSFGFQEKKTKFRTCFLQSLNNLDCAIETNVNFNPFIYRKLSNCFCRPRDANFNTLSLPKSILKTKRNPVIWLSNFCERLTAEKLSFNFASDTERSGLFFQNLYHKQFNFQNLSDFVYFYFQQLIYLKAFSKDKSLNQVNSRNVFVQKEKSPVFFFDFDVSRFRLFPPSIFSFYVCFFLMISALEIRRTSTPFLFFRPQNFFVSEMSLISGLRSKNEKTSSFSKLAFFFFKSMFCRTRCAKNVFLVKKNIVKNRLLFFDPFIVQTFFLDSIIYVFSPRLRLLELRSTGGASSNFVRRLRSTSSDTVLESSLEIELNYLIRKFKSHQNFASKTFLFCFLNNVPHENSKNFDEGRTEFKKKPDIFVNLSGCYLQKKHVVLVNPNEIFLSSFFTDFRKLYLQKLKQIFKTCSSQNQELLIKKLSRKIAPWLYMNQNYLIPDDLRCFDLKVNALTWRWSCRRHSSKSKKWIQFKYYRKFQNKRWFFGKIQPLKRTLFSKNLLKNQNNLMYFSSRATGFFYLPLHSQFCLAFKQRGLICRSNKDVSKIFNYNI